MNEHITCADIGRRVTSLRKIDWDWYTPAEDAVVLAVKTHYYPAHIAVEVGSEIAGLALWYASENVKLETLKECA